MTSSETPAFDGAAEEPSAQTPAYVRTPTTAPGGAPAFRVPSRTPPLYEAMNAPRYARQNLIKEIEQITATTLICYVSPQLEIGRDDVVGMVDLLYNTKPGTPIDLLLHSPGGNIDAAEKLITLIRKRAGMAPVRVIIPDYAKSAATLIALGADTILMSDSSELARSTLRLRCQMAMGTSSPSLPRATSMRSTCTRRTSRRILTIRSRD